MSEFDFEAESYREMSGHAHLLARRAKSYKKTPYRGRYLGCTYDLTLDEKGAKAIRKRFNQWHKLPTPYDKPWTPRPSWNRSNAAAIDYLLGRYKTPDNAKQTLYRQCEQYDPGVPADDKALEAADRLLAAIDQFRKLRITPTGLNENTVSAYGKDAETSKAVEFALPDYEITETYERRLGSYYYPVPRHVAGATDADVMSLELLGWEIFTEVDA